MENFNIDAYKPDEIAARIEQISISKSTTDPVRVFTLALLAGAFIAFAAAFFTVVTHKSNLGFRQALASGILCNALVCLAVWLCFACHIVTDKILAILFPISAFVTLGFEHSVANMYFNTGRDTGKVEPRNFEVSRSCN